MDRNKQREPVGHIPPHIVQLLKKSPALAKAARYGVDIPLLLDNLRRPVSERIRRHQSILNSINKLRNAMHVATEKSARKTNRKGPKHKKST
jgi:hypothetical protein